MPGHHILREKSRARKAANKVSSLGLLRSFNIPLEEQKDGSVLVRPLAGGEAMFWPTTGFWRLKSGQDGRGVFTLMQALGFDVAKKSETR
jgi:hypothetical protein